jgi:hypothetical protein
LKDFFQFNKNRNTLRVTAECERSSNKIGLDWVKTIDDHLKANVVTDVYVLPDETGDKYYDACVMILKDPVKFKGEIVPEIKLTDLNVINPGVGPCPPYHIETSLELEKQPIIIGYWLMGIDKKITI